MREKKNDKCKNQTIWHKNNTFGFKLLNSMFHSEKLQERV